MESLYRLKDLLCDQIEEIVAKNDITPVELDRVYKVIDVIKDICTIDAMENAEYDELTKKDHTQAVVTVDVEVIAALVVGAIVALTKAVIADAEAEDTVALLEAIAVLMKAVATVDVCLTTMKKCPRST